MSLHHLASFIHCLIWILTLASFQNRLLNLHLWFISDCFTVHYVLFFAKSVWTRTLFSLQFHHFFPIKLILHWGTILVTNNIEILSFMRFEQLIGLSLLTYRVFYLHWLQWLIKPVLIILLLKLNRAKSGLLMNVSDIHFIILCIRANIHWMSIWSLGSHYFKIVFMNIFLEVTYIPMRNFLFMRQNPITPE